MAPKLVLAACSFVLLAAAVAESSRVAPVPVNESPPPPPPVVVPHAVSRDRLIKLLVFGDSFGDYGNLPNPDGELSKQTRAWFHPYGISDSLHHKKPTGRFSNGMVQSDFVAKIIGHEESPPAYMLKGDGGIGSSGMNFAVSSSGVLREPTFDTQVEQFREMISDGLVSKRDLLEETEDVLLLDVNTVVTELVAPAKEDSSTLGNNQFENTVEPCCESIDPKGYCGQKNETEDPQLWLCKNPSRYFYCDYLHPTHAGWKAVMQILQGPIMALIPRHLQRPQPPMI